MGNELTKQTAALARRLFPGKEVYLYDPPSGSDIVYRLRVPLVALLLALAVVSAFPVRAHYESPEAHGSTIQTLDDKKDNVLGMVATSTTLSVVVSAAPDDIGSAVSDQLMDISANLGIVLGVLYLEKYLVAILSTVGFGFIIPIGFAVLAFAVFGCRMPWSGIWRLGVKMLLLGTILVTVIPASTQVSNVIDSTYEVSKAAREEQREQEAKAQENAAAEDKEDRGLLESVGDFFASLPQKVVDGVKELGEDTLNAVNDLIEGVAVMVVTSCVIPVLVLLFSLWVANTLLGIDVSTPTNVLRERAKKMKPRPKETMYTSE